MTGYGDRRHFFFARGSESLCSDRAVPAVLVEAEKSALAIWAWSQRTGKPVFPIAMGGCWGWRGRVGRLRTAERVRCDHGHSKLSARSPEKLRRAGSVDTAFTSRGTRISIRTMDSIDSAKNRVGYRFQASLEEPVSVDSNVVVPKEMGLRTTYRSRCTVKNSTVETFGKTVTLLGLRPPRTLRGCNSPAACCA